MSKKLIKVKRFSIFRVEQEVYEILTIDGSHYWNVNGVFIKEAEFLLLKKYHKDDIKYTKITLYKASEIYDQIYLGFGFEINRKLGRRKLLCKRKYPDFSSRKKPLIAVMNFKSR